MEQNTTIRISAVENGFVVDLVPNRFGRAPDYETVLDNVRVFETIESLVGWLQGHFTYRPDPKPLYQWDPGTIMPA